jgi:hypothetical protein
VSEPPPPPEQPPPSGQPPPYAWQPPGPYGYAYPAQPGYPTYPPPPYGYWPQPQWTPPPPIDPRRLRPSRRWYLLAPIPALVGVVVAIVLVVSFVNRLDPDLDHFTTERAALVSVRAGEHAIYVQTGGTRGARDVPASELDCRVAQVGGDDRSLPIDTTTAVMLDVNGDSYESRFSFDAPRSGVYRVRCTGPRDLPLAVGPHLSVGQFVSLAFAVAAFLIGAILSAVIAIVVAVKRSNHKQRLQREALATQAQAQAAAPS